MAERTRSWKNRERLDVHPWHRGIREWKHFGRYNHTNAHGALGPHDHPGSIEVCHLIRGRQVYEVGGTQYSLTGGDLFVTFPNEIHSSNELPQEKGVLYWLIVEIPRRGRFLDLPTAEGQALREALLELPQRHFRGRDMLSPLLDRLMESCLAPKTALANVGLRAGLIEFLLEVVDCASANPIATSRDARPLQGVVHYIHRHLHEAIGLAELAELAQLSLPQFQARFKREFGIPPGEYVLRAKVEEACRRLRETDRTVTEIGFDLGFGSSQYFATVLKRFTGKTPSEIRAEGERVA